MCKCISNLPTLRLPYAGYNNPVIPYTIPTPSNPTLIQPYFYPTLPLSNPTQPYTNHTPIQPYPSLPLSNPTTIQPFSYANPTQP